MDRDAVVPDLARLDQPVERLERAALPDDGLDRIMQLVEIDVVALQLGQASIDRGEDVRRREVWHRPAGAEIAAHLGRDDYVVGPAGAAQRTPQQFFAVTITIDVSGVEEGAAEI